MLLIWGDHHLMDLTCSTVGPLEANFSTSWCVAMCLKLRRHARCTLIAAFRFSNGWMREAIALAYFCTCFDDKAWISNFLLNHPNVWVKNGWGMEINCADLFEARGLLQQLASRPRAESSIGRVLCELSIGWEDCKACWFVSCFLWSFIQQLSCENRKNELYTAACRQSRNNDYLWGLSRRSRLNLRDHDLQL